MTEGITCVRLGSGTAHCYFCDTRIERDWPCVERIWHHSGGEYVRNGATAGICRAGSLPEMAHVQCAWRLDTKGATQDCVACSRPCKPCGRVVNFIASRQARCSETSALRWCFDCAAAFISRHKDLLDGWLGAEQMQQGVAWVDRPLFPPPDLQAGCGLPPMAASRNAKEAFLAIFRSSSAETEALAVERHRKLQGVIVEALRSDKARVRQPGARVVTPVERKAKRMRIDSRSDERVAIAPRSTRSRSSPQSVKRMHVE